MWETFIGNLDIDQGFKEQLQSLVVAKWRPGVPMET